MEGVIALLIDNSPGDNVGKQKLGLRQEDPSCPTLVDALEGSRRLSGCCMSLGRFSAQGKQNPCRQHNQGKERRFPARFIVIKVMK